MKANPGGQVTGDAIVGRDVEVSEMWRQLERKSVLLTAERRVGKTTVLRKMAEHPQNGWVPLLCFVEGCGHPIECVERVYDSATAMEIQSKKGALLTRIRTLYQKISGKEIGGWKIPAIMSDWKNLLTALVGDIATNTQNRVLVVLDEFPLMVSKIAHVKDVGPDMAMDFLDALRAIRQEFEPCNQIRFVLSGSIGLHLVLEGLMRNHAYKSNPISGMHVYRLSGMCHADVKLMCRKYLDEEGIKRADPDEFDRHMFEATDGLPMCIQYICSIFQDSKASEVRIEDIDRVVRQLLDDRTVEGFVYAARRVRNYYADLRTDRMAGLILDMLSHEPEYVAEPAITNHVRSLMAVDDDRDVLSTLEILLDDNYLIRDTASAPRRYRFRYSILRRWWEINRG